MIRQDKLKDTFRIAKLLGKYVKKEPLSADEQAEIDKWLAASDGNKTLVERIADENELAFALLDLQDVDTDAELAKIVRKIKRRSVLHRSKWLRAAAAILIFLTVGIGLYWHVNTSDTSVELVVTSQDDALPGGNRATLILADGRTIDLSEAQTGIVVGEKQIVYEDGSAEIVDLSTETIDLYVLSTPRGGTYHVMLPDGTKVWLNSASSLKYPSKFVGDERTVELTGEAYFDVSHRLNDDTKPTANGQRLTAGGKIPFKVSTNGQVVEVLGTVFNISAYPDEQTVKTTLVEGKVKVTVNDNTQMTSILNPGEQAIIRGGAIDINAVDIDQYTAWKDGYFHFKSTSFAEVMAQMSRWYDIELVYQGKVPSQTFTGKMSRNVSLMNVLRFFKGSGIKFRLVEQKLFIEG